MMGCCESFSKTLLIFFNVLFFLLGCIFLGVGIWVKVDKSNLFEIMRKVNLDGAASSFDNSSSSFLNIVAIVLIVLGTFTFIIGFCGCCGAIKENHCLLYLYSFLVGVVILIEVGIGIYAGVENGKFKTKIESALVDLLKSEFNGVVAPNATIFTKVFTAIMLELRCCGVKDPTDFNSTKFEWRQIIDNVKQANPIGCCATNKTYVYDTNKNFNLATAKTFFKNPECATTQDPEKAQLNKEGCSQSLINLISKNLAIVIGVCVGLGLFEIFCIVFACCVIGKKEY